MASRNLILLSLIFAPLSMLAESAADYVHRGAQQYIFGHDDVAEAAVTAGLTKFPNDPELQKMTELFRKKKDDQSQGGGNKKQDQQNQDQQKQQQQNQSQQNQQQQQQNQQPQSKDQSGKGENQKQDRQSPGQSPSPTPGEKSENNPPSPSASPSAGNDQREEPNQTPPTGDQPSQSPTPGGNDNEAPTPSPGENENGEDASPTATPTISPQKKLAGEVKGAEPDKSNKPPAPTAQAIEAEANKEGQLSEQQALALLQSMKDEEARVQLDERRPRRHVYNDW